MAYAEAQSMTTRIPLLVGLITRLEVGLKQLLEILLIDAYAKVNHCDGHCEMRATLLYR